MNDEHGECDACAFTHRDYHVCESVHREILCVYHRIKHRIKQVLLGDAAVAIITSLLVCDQYNSSYYSNLRSWDIVLEGE